MSKSIYGQICCYRDAMVMSFDLLPQCQGLCHLSLEFHPIISEMRDMHYEQMNSGEMKSHDEMFSIKYYDYSVYETPPPINVIIQNFCFQMCGKNMLIMCQKVLTRC